MRKSFFLLSALAVLTSMVLMGCPWSTSQNVFDGLPTLGGPPPQSEPPLENTGRTSQTRGADEDAF